MGLGLITAASDDDPSGIATYSQAGAQFGFAISWTMLFSDPLMVAIQEKFYPKWLLVVVPLIFVANTINIGADLGAMADALSLLSGGSCLFYVVVHAPRQGADHDGRH